MQAFTEIGSGRLSRPVSVHAAKGLPLPAILASSNDSIFIYDIDINSTKTIVNIISPLKLNYFMNEQWLIWINQKHELIHYDISKSLKTKLISINGKPMALSLDWLERSLYYVEVNNASIVFKIDLNYAFDDIVPIRIMNRKNKIFELKVSPFTKSLYWIEIKQNKSILMQSNSDGSNTRVFLKERQTLKDYNKICNCTHSFLDIERVFALDHSLTSLEPSVIFIDKKTRKLISSDSDGCLCKVIAENVFMKNDHVLTKMNGDFGMVYWTNHDELTAFNRNKNGIFTVEVSICMYIRTILSMMIF